MKIFSILLSKKIYMPIIIIILAIVIQKVLLVILNKILNPNKKLKKEDTKRILTLKSILSNIIKYVVWIIAIICLLGVYGVDTTAILTGLGLVSLIVGLAFQDILKDIFAGISILFEDIFAIGDYVKVGTFEGRIIFLGLKTTKIQADTGEVKIISNRNISEVINYSRDNSLAIVDVPVVYDAKVDKVEKILQVTAATLKDKIPELLDEATVLGLEQLSLSSMVFRITGKCKSSNRLSVERQIKKEIKKTLDKNGINLPEVNNEK